MTTLFTATEIGRLREQWDFGTRTAAVAPAVVVAYQRNQQMNRRLLDHGLEARELDASELGRDPGSSRSMTRSILRDALP